MVGVGVILSPSEGDNESNCEIMLLKFFECPLMSFEINLLQISISMQSPVNEAFDVDEKIFLLQ